MAKKLDPAIATDAVAPDAVAGAESDDLDVLHPERRLVIAGRDITVREYAFTEGLRLQTLARPFTEGLYALLTADAAVSFERVLGLIGDHYEAVLELVAISANVEQRWLDSLGDEDGNLLLMAWWGACGPFFLRSAVRRLQVARQEQAALQRIVQAAAQRSAGATSTPALSPTDIHPATAPDRSAPIPGDSFTSTTPPASGASDSNAEPT